MPGEPRIVVDSSTSQDRNKRIYLATYPAMMKCFEDFDVGFFDLIIADESHRSIYKKFRTLFRYFDALEIGLTATPVRFVERNTYDLFECADRDPTAAYELEDAINATPPFLVPFRVKVCTTWAREDGFSYRDLLERMAEAQISRAVEAAAAPWTETDVVTVERGDERRPNSLEDLFRLVRRHLSRVGQLVENDSFSYRGLFKPETPEKEIQRWAASSLKLLSGGLYSVVREPEVDDQNEVDILALADRIGQVPIEIKPLGPYSLNELTTCISGQLYAKYMRPPDVKYGVLLLVRQTDKEWKVDGTLQGFAALVAAVRAYADAFGAANDKVIAVETIDLLPRERG
jgi:Type III restriction enzyme, res subunit